MIEIRKAADRGHANHGWLDSYHTFSFGSFYDPDFQNFRALRVINEDRVEPNKGFGTHPHNNMEILSYIISGKLQHQDSMGNGSVINQGEIQIISAGTGITHSEFNPSDSEQTHFYQIWITPEKQNLQPSYQQKAFQLQSPGLKLIACQNPQDQELKINQDVKIYKGLLSPEQIINLPLEKNRYAWLQIIQGDCRIDEHLLSAGDGAAISQEESLQVISDQSCEFLFFDLP